MDSLILWWHCFREFSFCSFGACQSGADFSARKRGFEAAARLFELADGTVDDDDDHLSEKGDKQNSRQSRLQKLCVCIKDLTKAVIGMDFLAILIPRPRLLSKGKVVEE